MSTIIFAFAVCCSVAASADDRIVRLSAPDALFESDLLKYILPRFSLKSQVKVEVMPPGSEVDAALGSDGRPLFEGKGRTWSLQILNADHAGAAKFESWITSEVGLRTIADFKVDGASVFTVATLDREAEPYVKFEGDAALGLELSVTHCGRCHVSVSDRPMLGIGSTPSFFVLRALDDWDSRFQTFYVRNPHPAFTQIVDATQPFAKDRPSPIVPVELTRKEFDAILAYVFALEPADLGAPLKHQ